MVDADGADDGLASVDDLLEALNPSATRLADLLKSTSLDEHHKRTAVKQAYFKAASSGNSELLEWLLAPANPARRFLDLEARDSEGSPAIVLAAVFGHGDVIRVLSEHGADINATDAKGWSPLHWSLRNSNLPLSSFLINRRASTVLRSHTGLAAVDLIRKGSQGEVLRDVARELADEARSSVSSISGNSSHSMTRPASLPEHTGQGRTGRGSKHTSLPIVMRSAEQDMYNEERLRLELAMESARNLDVDFSLLDMDLAIASRLHLDVPDEEDESSLDDEAEEAVAFEWNDCLPEQMIGFSLQDLPALLDTSIEIRPSRSQKERFFPANIVFLAARFASRFGGEDLLGELMIGAIDRIEASIHSHADDLAHSAFWLSNAMLLVYYLRRDSHTVHTTLEYQENLHDLMRAISAFCVRGTERRLDKILDAALLDHEPLPGYEDIRFEDEWRLLKALTSRGKKDASLGVSPALRPSVLGLFGTPDRTFSSSNTSSPASRPSTPGRMRTPSMPTLRSTFGIGMAPSTPPSLSEPELSPRSVTAILSSTLFILQHYDYAGHPAVVLQIFSQLLYWLASELFNRILTKKRHLCRSRALQIRLNVSSLEDWARTNRLPATMVNAHFRPVNELLQWLQCLSSESSIDGLLATMQNLQTLNPLQMRRAARDYRHEVDETKISEECTQYLAQLQKDWERRRLLQGLDNAAREAERRASTSTGSSISGDRDDSSSISLHSNESSRTSDPRSLMDNPTHEALAGYKWDANAYESPERPPCFDELLDSRVILPFVPPLMDHNVQPASFSFGPLYASRARIPRSSPNVDIERTASPPADSILTLPTPAVPEDFLDMLRQAKAYYSTDEYEEERSHQPLGDSKSPVVQDYWLNWRDRLETELSTLEEQDNASPDDAL